jgi:NitT/TauT family transport system ATP-binding protein
MPIVEVSRLTKTYGSGASAFTALGDISFSAEEGEFVSIVGPSGAGKTTLLKCLSGLMPPTSGEVRVLGERVTRPPRAMGVVFQDYSRSLMPWLSVRKNVEFPLGRAARRDPAARARVDAALASVGLADVPARYPWQLSGGMQQRVAIARALAYAPSILVMDEPFASVDAQTRFELEDLVLKVREEFGVTILFVTHDIDEAVYLSSRIVVLGDKPTTVRSEIVNDLPWPRTQTETRDLPDFAHLRTQLYQLLVATKHHTASVI